VGESYITLTGGDLEVKDDLLMGEIDERVDVFLLLFAGSGLCIFSILLIILCRWGE